MRAAVRSAVAGEWNRAKQDLLGKAMNLGPVRGLLASRMRSEAEKKAPHPLPGAFMR